jgi:hypothetical protein
MGENGVGLLTVVFQRWGKSKKSLNSGVSATKKEQRVADNGVSAMENLVFS